MSQAIPQSRMHRKNRLERRSTNWVDMRKDSLMRVRGQSEGMVRGFPGPKSASGQHIKKTKLTFSGTIRPPMRYIPKPLLRTITTVISVRLLSDPSPAHSSSSSSSMTLTTPLRGAITVEGKGSRKGSERGCNVPSESAKQRDNCGMIVN